MASGERERERERDNGTQLTSRFVKKLNDSGTLGFENTGDKITTLCLSVSHSLLVPGHLQTVFLPAAKKVGAASAPSKAKF